MQGVRDQRDWPQSICLIISRPVKCSGDMVVIERGSIGNGEGSEFSAATNQLLWKLPLPEPFRKLPATGGLCDLLHWAASVLSRRYAYEMWLRIYAKTHINTHMRGVWRRDMKNKDTKLAQKQAVVYQRASWRVEMQSNSLLSDLPSQQMKWNRTVTDSNASSRSAKPTAHLDSAIQTSQPRHLRNVKQSAGICHNGCFL